MNLIDILTAGVGWVIVTATAILGVPKVWHQVRQAKHTADAQPQDKAIAAMEASMKRLEIEVGRLTERVHTLEAGRAADHAEIVELRHTSDRRGGLLRRTALLFPTLEEMLHWMLSGRNPPAPDARYAHQEIRQLIHEFRAAGFGDGPPQGRKAEG